MADNIKIYQALCEIRDTCKQRDDCVDCPIAVKSTLTGSLLCGVNHILPEEWKLIVPSNYKAFKED